MQDRRSKHSFTEEKRPHAAAAAADGEDTCGGSNRRSCDRLPAIFHVSKAREEGKRKRACVCDWNHRVRRVTGVSGEQTHVVSLFRSLLLFPPLTPSPSFAKHLPHFIIDPLRLMILPPSDERHMDPRRRHASGGTQTQQRESVRGSREWIFCCRRLSSSHPLSLHFSLRCSLDALLPSFLPSSVRSALLLCSSPSLAPSPSACVVIPCHAGHRFLAIPLHPSDTHKRQQPVFCLSSFCLSIVAELKEQTKGKNDRESHDAATEAVPASVGCRCSSLAGSGS